MILPGPVSPAAYEFSWNDELLSLNQFASITQNAVGGVCQLLDTQVTGQPVVVYNPLDMPREDIVKATIYFPSGLPAVVRVYDGNGIEVPSQVISKGQDHMTILFLAAVPSVGVSVFDIRESETPCTIDTGLSITGNTFSNGRYTVTIDDNGDIESIYDLLNAHELLAQPLRLELLNDYSPSWPAWEVLYNDVQNPPYSYVSAPADIKVVESGPARITIEVRRTFVNETTSTFIQRISLSAGGASDIISVENLVDWQTQGTLLKASFPLAVSNSEATYDLGMGTIRRGNNQSNSYEIPAQWWADITDNSGDYGVTILNDCKYGWDKPTNNTLRLTLLHTPAVSSNYTDPGYPGPGPT